MPVLMVRYEVKEDAAADVEAGIQKLFAAIDAEQPSGLRYAFCKLPDGVTFIGLVQLT
jgi:hypothetical protein